MAGLIQRGVSLGKEAAGAQAEVDVLEFRRGELERQRFKRHLVYRHHNRLTHAAARHQRSEQLAARVHRRRDAAGSPQAVKHDGPIVKVEDRVAESGVLVVSSRQEHAVVAPFPQVNRIDRGRIRPLVVEAGRTHDSLGNVVEEPSVLQQRRGERRGVGAFDRIPPLGLGVFHVEAHGARDASEPTCKPRRFRLGTPHPHAPHLDATKPATGLTMPEDWRLHVGAVDEEPVPALRRWGGAFGRRRAERRGIAQITQPSRRWGHRIVAEKVLVRIGTVRRQRDADLPEPLLDLNESDRLAEVTATELRDVANDENRFIRSGSLEDLEQHCLALRGGEERGPTRDQGHDHEQDVAEPEGRGLSARCLTLNVTYTVHVRFPFRRGWVDLYGTTANP